jgi:type IV pilus assembly protein PilW
MMTLVRQQGATLIELLVSVVIGLIIAASMVGMYVNSTANSSQILKSSKLNQELTSLMTVMVNDIRRAGYAGDFLGAVSDNKFTYFDDGATELENVIRVVTRTDTLGNTLYDCILYAYNTDGFAEEGAVPTNDDIRGFRLNNGAVEMLRLTKANTNAQVQDSYCTIIGAIGEDDKDGDNLPDWLPLTDPATTRIEALTFNMDDNSSCLNLSLTVNDTAGAVYYCNDYYGKYLRGESTTTASDLPGPDDIIHLSNQVGIQLTGELISDDTTSLTIGDANQAVNVRLRNDILWEGPLPAL